MTYLAALFALFALLLGDAHAQEEPCADGPTQGATELTEDLSATLDAVSEAAQGVSDAVRAITPQTLQDALRAALKHDKPDLSALTDLIHKATTAQRQTALKDSALLKEVNKHFTKPETITVSASLMEGSYNWVNPPKSDFYQFYYEEKGDEPCTESSMNCWEFVMQAAMATEQIDDGWVQDFYRNALKTQNRTAMVWYQLGYLNGANRNPMSKDNLPKPGQLIFWTTKGAPYPDHVGLAVSDTEAMSLWNQPNDTTSVQRVTISDIKGTVYIGDAPW